MKRKILCCVLVVSMLTGCFSYRDMNRLLFFTMGAVDYKEGHIYFFGEAFKGYRGEGDKVGQEKRVLLYGQGMSLTDAAEEMRNSVNYSIQYDGSKATVFSKAMAEEGLAATLDVINRDQKPSMRQYLFVFDGDISELLSVVMEDEQFTGLYLYEMMNSQKDMLNMTASPFYEFLRNMRSGSGINIVPMLKMSTLRDEMENPRDTSNEQIVSPQVESSQPQESHSSSESSGDSKASGDKQESSEPVDEGNETAGGAADQSQKGEGESPERGNLDQKAGKGTSGDSQGKSGQGGSSGGSSDQGESQKTPLDYSYIILDGAAIMANDKMVGTLTEAELRTYKLLKERVKWGYLHSKNPQHPDHLLGFLIGSKKSKHTVRVEDERIKVNYTVKVRAVLQEADPSISAEDKVIVEQIRTSLVEQMREDITELYENMKSQGIDILDIKKDLEVKSIDMGDDFLDLVDFEPTIEVTLDGLGTVRQAYY